jgi:hypothetical protein
VTWRRGASWRPWPCGNSIVTTSPRPTTGSTPRIRPRSCRSAPSADFAEALPRPPSNLRIQTQQETRQTRE